MANTDPLGDVIPELSLVRNPQDGLYYKVSPTELDLFTRSSAPPLPADDAIATPEEQGTSVLDYGKLFMLGGAQAAQGIGWLTKKAGLESFGQAVEDLGTNAVDYWQNALTPAMQKELAKQFIVKNDMGEYEWGDAGFGTAIATGVTSLPSTMLSFGVGGGLTKVLQVFANPVGRSALVQAAKAGSEAAAKKLAFVDSVLGTAGFGAAEGLQSGASVGQQVESQVLKLPPEKVAQSERYQEIFNSTDEDMPWAERHNYAVTTLAKEAATEAGWQSGLTTALLGAPMGAFFGRALGKRVSDMMASTASRRIGTAAAGEAAQEFLQSGGEQLFQNRALMGAGDTDRGTWDDVLNQAVGGALAGGALGGAFGVFEGGPREQQQSSGGTAAGGAGAAPPGTATPPPPAGAAATAPAAAGPAGTPGTTATPGPRLPKAAQDTLAAAARAAVAAGADRAQVLEVVKRAASGQSELLPTLRVLNDMGKAAGEAGPSSSSPSTAAEAPPAGPAAAVSPEGAAPPSPSTAPTGASAGLPIPGDTVQAAPEPPKPAGVPAASEGQTTPKAASADVPRGTVAEPFPVRADGEDEAAHAARAKAWLKANIDPRPVPDPRSMSKDPAAYFDGGTAVPIGRVITEKDAGDKGGRIALTRFQAAAQGEIPKRAPVKVRDNGDGTYTVLDGNGTVNAMRTMGLPAVNVEVTETVPKVEKRVVPGARQTAYAGQMPVDAQFQLRELADLVPSHTADGSPDPRYPQERQNRDRSRVASQVWVKETAGSFVPEKMIEGVDIGAGAPVVDSGGIVDSGNGRVLLLNEVYNQGKEGPYREYLRANAAKFGLTPEQVDSFKQPALVRTRPDTMSAADVIAMTREANRPQIATLSPAEQARNDSERISDEAMMLYSPDESGNVLASSNDRFISAFMREIPAAERGELMTSDGKPNKVLADRLRAAMFQRAYGDERLLNAMAEDADPEFKNVLTALTNAAPAFAKARSVGANELIPDLIDGVELVRKAKREGMTVEQLLNQGQMFDPVPPGPARMAKFLAANMRSAKRMSTALSELGAALERNARGKQSADMFGGTPESPQGLLDAVNQDMTRRFVFGGGQSALFSRDKNPRAELFAVTAEPGRPLLKARVPKQQWRYVWARFIGTQLGLDMDGLFSRGMAAQSELVTTATETEGRVGGHFVNPDMKKRATTEGKLIRKGIQPGRVTDIARGGFVADSPEQADEIVNHIASRYAIVDEGWETTPAGYTDRKVAVRMSNGLIAELQLWSAPMKAAKMEGLDGSMKGQKMYDEWRDLEVRNPQTGELTIKDPVRYYELGAQMNRLYALAIDRSIAQNPAWKKTLADPDALRAIADQLEAKSVAAGGTSGSSAPSMYSRASDSVSSRPEPIVSSAEQGTQPSPRLTRAAMSGNASQTIATPADSTSQNDRLATAQSTTATPPSSSVPDSPPGGPLFRRADPVDSPAFKAWFGQSKIVDENGRPLVVYHGTRAAFDAPNMRHGFYSSPSEEYAQEFAMYASGDAEPNVIPMYLKAERPMDLRDLGEQRIGITRLAEAMMDRGLPAAQARYFEDVMGRDSPPQKVWQWLRRAPKVFQDVLSGGGFDSLQQIESTEYDAAEAFWTWMPGRYKRTDNAGTFDESNPSMLYRRAGQTSSPAFREWFGASKAIDPATGEPRRFYHGRLTDFDAFDRNEASRGGHHGNMFYFTTSPQDTNVNYATPDGGDQAMKVDMLANQLPKEPILAELRAQGKSTDYESVWEASREKAIEQLGSQANTMPVYLQVKNPVVVGVGIGMPETEWDENEIDGIVSTMEAYQNHEMPELRQKLFEEHEPGDMITASALEDAVRENGDATNYEGNAGWGPGALLADTYEAMGFDGVVINASQTFPRMEIPAGTQHWTVFRPTQIKSAVGNRGTFDRMNESVLMRRTPGGASGLTAETVQQSIGKAASEVAPAVRVRVVQSVADLGDRAIPGDVEGVYWPGGNEVVLVADNLRDAEHVQRVFAHEVFGHLAAEQHPAFQEALQAVYRLKGIGSREVVAAWNHVARTQPGLDRTTHAKEVIARIAESGTDAPWFRKLVDAVRAQLRSWGLNLNWTEADLRAFIRDAATDLRQAAYRRRYMDRHDGIARQLAGLAAQQKLQDENAAAQPLNDLYPHDAIDWILELDAELAALEATGKAPRRPEQATPEPRPEAYADTATYGPGIPPEDAEPPVMQYGQNRYAGMQFSRSAPLDPALASIYERVMQVPPDQLPFRDRIRAFVGRLKKNDVLSVKQGLVDSFASIEALEKGRFGAVLDAAQSAYKAALATKNLPSVMAAVMMRGVPEYRDGAFQPVAGRKGFIEIFKPLTTHADGNLLNHWKLWAAANRAQRLIKEGREKLFTQADIDEALKLEQKYPFFRDVLNDWQAFNKQLLDLAEDRGIIDPDSRALWAANDYVPFYRVMEDAEGAQGPGTGGGLSGSKANIKRLSGSDLQLGDVLENMILNTTHLIDRSFRNTAMQRIVGLADGVAMDKVPMPALPKKYGLEQVRSALAKVGIDVGDLSPEQLDQYVTLWNRVAPKGPDIVSVYEKGKAEYYRVSDPLLLRSVAGMGFDNFSDVLGVFRGSKKLLTHAITADPSFMLANFVRDTLSNWVTSSASPHPFVGAFKGFKSSITEDENLMKLMMAGGGGGGYYDSNPEDVRKLLADKVPAGQMNAFMKTIVTPKTAWKVWRKIGAATENANRIGVFKAVIERGGSVAEAAYEARDVLNFAMSGDYAAMRWLMQTVPFMNARVQGLYRLYRGARENPRSFALKGMAVMAATMALLLRNNDRKEYEELREWDKDTYWHLFIGGEHYRIPKPFEIGIIFATMPERLMRWGSGRDSHQILMKQIQSAVMDTLAFNPTPQLIKPLIEQYANRSMFTGTPIVGMAERQLKPEAQFDAWTSETARELAKALPDFAPEWLRSPVRLQAAVRAYTGTLGMYVLNASDYVTRAMGGYPEAPSGSKYDLPVLGRFMRDPNPRSTKYSDQLYAMLEEANALHATINRYRREGQLQTAADLLQENRGKLAVRGRLNAIALQVRNVNNQIRLTQLSRSLSPDEKKARIDALLQRKNDLTARVAPLSAAF